ncbi:hypothetical protein HP397_05165 [Streptobacillus felis]|uniref:Uncharacterized protein n=1 Tax=Streptobacillus felis TaxID=1384509 RepID=A0A7Z0PF96_9FUSO|nr:hypothetical protein [Streptobacillus felis]NYV28194.1 hypothetical protein [Streptobacillus felis]
MKKIFIFLFLSILSFTNSDKILNQEFLLSHLNFENIKVYEKYKKVHARKAIEGEEILTITKDGIETKNIAKKNNVVVKNLTDAKEMYIMSEEKFNKRYKFIENFDEFWSIYIPIGKVKAIKVDENILTLLNIEDKTKTFFITAAWGENMIVKLNDFLVTPLDNSEVYRIAEHEFFETYK